MNTPVTHRCLNKRTTGSAIIHLFICLAGTFVLLAGCASLPDSAEQGQRKPAPVLGHATHLKPRAAELAIQSAAGADNEQARAELNELIDAVRRATDSPFMLGNQVTPLLDGPETFAHLRRWIADAKSSIHVETYIFADDELGKAFAQSLIDKARQGVEVRVIFDALGSMTSADALFDSMRDAGVQVEVFHPLSPLHTLPWRYNNRDHRKLLIVDGRVAFTGGLNISAAYASGSTSRPGPERGITQGWRDTHAQIEGPAVRLFQSIFFETWVSLGGQVDASNAKYFPEASAKGTDIVSAVASSGLRQKDEAIYSSYLAAVTHASQRVWITQAYFSPPPQLRDALLAAVRRGVDVRVLVPGFTDSGPVFYAARGGYAKLLKGGVRIYELTEALLHAKTAVIDDSLSVIGSANFDYRSFLHNNEVTAVVVSEHLATNMQDIFKEDLGNAREITAASWRRRSAGEKLKETFSRLFNYWL